MSEGLADPRRSATKNRKEVLCVCVCGSYFVCSMGGSLAEKLIRVGKFRTHMFLGIALFGLGMALSEGYAWREMIVVKLMYLSFFENFLKCHL